MTQGRLSEECIAAARRLGELGAERCIPVLSAALAKGSAALQIQAARALGAIYKRHADVHILEALNAAVLHERQSAQARQAAVESLAQIIDVRHAGSLIEVLKSSRSPMPVRAAALRCLKRLGYAEVLERLVESSLFAKRLDPRGEIGKWAIHELIALDDRDKLTKIHEIAHGRRRLRYRTMSDEAGGPAALVFLMAQIDPKGAQRFLNRMVDDENPAIRSAAAQALRNIRGENIPTA